MLALIRISGQIKIRGKIVETLNRLRLGRKYTCVILPEDKKEINGMIKKVKNLIAFGKIDDETLFKLIEERGKIIGNKKGKVKAEEVEKISKEIIMGKKFEEFNIKPFFCLHPPRGGINSKLHFPKGVLGNNGNKINELIRRML